jgi:hypothetical protein
MPQPNLRRRFARVRPYLPPATPAAESTPGPGLLTRVLHGLRALPVHQPPPPRDDRSPLVRFIDAERARTVADRTPTQEIPVVAEGVSWQ